MKIKSGLVFVIVDIKLVSNIMSGMLLLWEAVFTMDGFFTCQFASFTYIMWM